jgi:hypothetical protein
LSIERDNSDSSSAPVMEKGVVWEHTVEEEIEGSCRVGKNVSGPGVYK